MSTSLRGLCAACALALLAPAGRADDLTDLLRRLPESANAVAVINVKAVRQSSGGDGSGGAGYEIVGGMIVPPAVDAVVYATHLDPGQLLSRKTVGLFLLNKPVPLADVAEKTFGKVVDLDGT